MLNRETLLDYIKSPRDQEQDGYLSPATQYYLKIFDRYCRGGPFDPRNGFGSWNWWAFLCGPIWYAYRKMYLFSIISMVIITGCLFLPSPWDLTSQIVIAILLGAFGNSLYFTHIDYWVKKGLIDRKGTTYVMPTLIVILPWTILFFVWFYYTAKKIMNGLILIS